MQDGWDWAAGDVVAEKDGEVDEDWQAQGDSDRPKPRAGISMLGCECRLHTYGPPNS
jgi:hypothetical protein